MPRAARRVSAQMHRCGQGNHSVSEVCGLLRLNWFLAASPAAAIGDSACGREPALDLAAALQVLGRGDIA